MTEPSRNAQHIAWGPERFFWAIVDPQALRGRRSAEGLAFLAEAQLPAPLEDLHLVFHDLEDGTVLVCAVERQALQREVPPEARTLTPQHLPDCLAAQDVRLEAMSLLTGEHTPAEVRLARQNRNRVVHLALLLVAALVVVGLELRRLRLGTQERHLDLALGQTIQEQLPASARNPLLPAELQLEAYFRSLRRTRVVADTAEAQNAFVLLERILTAWPPDIEAQTEAVLVHPDSVHVRALLPTSEAAGLLSESLLEALPDWSRPMPSVERDRAGFRLVHRWEYDPAGGRP